MRESILSRIATCKHCGKAFIINVEGENGECDECIDSGVADDSEDLDVNDPDRFGTDCV